jgi:putative salt-induced outer membrane protein YdiY
MPNRTVLRVASVASLLVVTGTARAQPTGAPPPDEKAAVAAPSAPADKPAIDAPLDVTNLSLASGGQLATGNARLLAATVSGTFEMRHGYNGIGTSILGNYGQGAPPGQAVQATTENLQARLRYDRYIAERASFFGIVTGRHDRFQGLDFRLNLDPGFKYILATDERFAFWAEAGYDFQYDIRRDAALPEVDDAGKPVLDANGRQVILSKTATDHSSRLFVGYRHAFNKEVTLSTGIEYLQSFVDSTRYRMNFDSLFAAKVAGGLAVGLGFSARFDHAPLPGKEELDTSTTVSLIYAYSDVATPPAK